ncbi:hypothetical protein BaRGS_00012605 [Batillaria attramentaria]|uniref:Uncharacterized protein n=1 Tax=Batillaria attramentaria TaxID=370345 RepID=A0ABD0LAF3_9CAEN
MNPSKLALSMSAVDRWLPTCATESVQFRLTVTKSSTVPLYGLARNVMCGRFGQNKYAPQLLCLTQRVRMRERLKSSLSLSVSV